MKPLIFILSLLLFIYATKKAPGPVGYYHGYADTSILGPVFPDQGQEPIDTNLLPPPDTTSGSIGPRNHLLMEELYNNLPLDPLIKGYNQPGGDCCAWSQELSDTMFNTSPTSMRFDVRSTDPLIAGSPRSEDNIVSNFEPALNFERWYGVALGFPMNYLKDVSPEIVTQLHALDSSPPPVAIWTLNDHIYFAYKGGSLQDYGLIPKGTFVSFVFHVIWDTDGTHGGLIEIWMNGVLRTQRFGANSPPGLASGPYMKVGPYCWKWSHAGYVSVINTRVLYVDDWRIGDALATYSDVAP